MFVHVSIPAFYCILSLINSIYGVVQVRNMARRGRPPRQNRTPYLTAMEMMANAMREQAQATANLVAHLTRGTPAASADTTGANA